MPVNGGSPERGNRATGSGEEGEKEGWLGFEEEVTTAAVDVDQGQRRCRVTCSGGRQGKR
ncbi:hypothetical protein E2562_024276 [Oryza meyeriana var. granulata]|uniref:DUF834 domain-containing protein n=1 Tax=Oryza meyeriana var. granulata TaxID=110450 RepID=A0A6G1E3J2_9ORYZ|nr:hypothetical protein E2562_024276 [Oryza meyeriana var. granulata]